MKSFIRAAEVWVPSADRTILEFGGGLYGTATRFAAVSRDLCFGYGEGLPGHAWELGHPIVLKAFEGTYFRRTKAAHAEGITCAIAVPIFAGDFLTSVLVVFCGDAAGQAGAIELWKNDPAESHDMTLDDGYYGATADTFEFTSRRTSFRRGNGLPGMAWESGLPVVLEDLGKSARFLRADVAVRVGINRGFAIPFLSRGGVQFVLAFLSALGTPIAHRFEIWRPDAEHERMRLVGGFCEAGGTIAPAPAHLGPARGEGTVGRVLLSGVPAFSDNAAAEPGGHGVAAAEIGLQSVMAVPLIQQGRIVAAAVFYFQ